MNKDIDINGLRIGLDIDGVLACFSCGVLKRARQMGLEQDFPESCEEVDPWDMSHRFSEVMKDAWRDDEFWLGLPALTTYIPFTPYVYITSRQISSITTMQWLDKYGFPHAPVITVSNPKQKLEHIKNLKLDIFVDDLHDTVRDIRNDGVNALLHFAPYQRGHVVECGGLPVINNLWEISEYV